MSLFGGILAGIQSKATVLDLEKYMLGVGGTSSGQAVNASTAMQCSAVYSCVRVVSETIAQLPCITYQREGRAKERARDHWLYPLLHDRPNSFQSAFEFWEQCNAHIELRGNFYAFINRLSGRDRRIVELIPLHPDRVEVEQAADLSLSYSYTSKSSNQRRFSQDEVFHVRGMSMDGIKGVGTIAYLRETIGLAMATEKYGARLFKSGAKNPIMLKSPAGKAMSQEAKARLKAQFDEAAAEDNWHRVILLQDGLEVERIGMTPEDSQFLETRKLGRSEICGGFRVPPHKIGDLERATFSNIEHSALEWVTDGVVPRVKRIEQAINRDLVPAPLKSSMFVEFLVDGILRGDFKSRMEGYQIATTNGIYSRNEARERENLNPYEGGDEFLTPMNMTTGEAADESRA